MKLTLILTDFNIDQNDKCFKYFWFKKECKNRSNVTYIYSQFVFALKKSNIKIEPVVGFFLFLIENITLIHFIAVYYVECRCRKLSTCFLVHSIAWLSLLKPKKKNTFPNISDS